MNCRSDIWRDHEAACDELIKRLQREREASRTCARRLRQAPMILLGINGGMGNHDCATMPLDVVDLEHAWIRYARPKTGRGSPAAPRHLALGLD